MDLAQTLVIVHAALRGDLEEAPTVVDPVFGLHVPLHVKGVPDEVLQPRATWADSQEYDAAAAALAARFHANFERFPQVSEAIKAAGPRG